VSVLPVGAQHPIDVERFSAQGEYLRAMAAFERLPQQRQTPASVLAAARSAWALGLNTQAAQAFDRALRNPILQPEERARILFARAVIELQSARPQVSTLYAERAVADLPHPSPLRAQVYAVWGRALLALNDIGAACRHLSQAAEESGREQLPEVSFELATCLQKTGRLKEAAESLERIPLDDERASSALRALATIALEMKDFEGAGFWLSKGRELFPSQFLDSWVDYAQVVVAANLERSDDVARMLKESTDRLPPSDPWFQLLRAVAEAYLWQQARSEPAESEATRARRSP
jgi:tetratricopeptide (TPR) repeat protein